MVSGVRNATVKPIGQDAAKGKGYGKGAKPVLAVVVAGETARSENFGLNGYGVQTNPRLSTLPVLSFTNVRSCGTATAVSLPCMFSEYERGTYSYERGVATENVLDVLSHAGFRVEWWDNNTGHKNIADRIAAKSFSAMKDPIYCGQGECVDGIFLQALKDYAGSITEDTVLVLHQIGSHGPAYYMRYPEAFEMFSPSCKASEFVDCTPAEIINAYDNTIAYTDEFLAEAIGVLDAQNRADTALIYVSDHGESLGEGGLYLHGAPYFMAPDQQTRVPMIMWLSSAFRDRFAIDQDCLTAQRDAELSHDNLFHSLLGMLDISTREHDANLDIFATCTSENRIASR
jgi:lipid A ethanolaminephosphotransferase